MSFKISNVTFQEQTGENIPLCTLSLQFSLMYSYITACNKKRDIQFFHWRLTTDFRWCVFAYYQIPLTRAHHSKILNHIVVFCELHLGVLDNYVHHCKLQSPEKSLVPQNMFHTYLIKKIISLFKVRMISQMYINLYYMK